MMSSVFGLESNILKHHWIKRGCHLTLVFFFAVSAATFMNKIQIVILNLDLQPTVVKYTHPERGLALFPDLANLIAKIKYGDKPYTIK